MTVEPVTLILHVNDDIEFMTKDQWDALQRPKLTLVPPPTPEEIERERQLAIAMERWVDDYEKAMEPTRIEWLNEVYNRE